MEVQRIKTEGARIDPVRNQPRVWLEVSTLASNGAHVEGHRVAGPVKKQDGTIEPQITRIEVYADRLGEVLKRTRTEEHTRVHEMALRMHEEARRLECQRRNKPLDTDLGITWNGAPELHYPILGYRAGLPPLTQCKVVHPASGETVDAFAFARLDAKAQREWLIDPPATPLTAAQNAHAHFSDVMERTFSGILDRIENKSGNKQR